MNLLKNKISLVVITSSLLSSLSLAAMECKYLSFTQQVSPMITKSHWVNGKLYLEGKQPEVLDYSRFKYTKDLVEKPQVLRLNQNTLVSVTADLAGNKNIELVLWKRDLTGKFNRQDSVGLSHKFSSALLETYVRNADAMVDSLSPLKQGQDPSWNLQNFYKLGLTALGAVPVKSYQALKEVLYRMVDPNGKVIGKFIDYKITPLNENSFAFTRRMVDSFGKTIQYTEIYKILNEEMLKTSSHFTELKRYDYDKVKSVFLADGKILDVGSNLKTKQTSFHIRSLEGQRVVSEAFDVNIPRFERIDLMGPNEVLVRASSEGKQFYVVRLPNTKSDRPLVLEFRTERIELLDALVKEGFSENQLVGSFALPAAKDSVFMHIPKSWRDTSYNFLQNGVLQTRSAKGGKSLELDKVISLPHAAIDSIARNAKTLNTTELKRALKNSYSINGNQKIYREGDHLVILSESYKYNQRFFVSVKMSVKGKPEKVELSMYEELKGDSDKILNLKILPSGEIQTTKVKDLE
jgi:hypothetical protein